ncbi:hypothetical protein MPH_05929 [Macrophomina phaseolina MS6]|uniref:Uncharacterized protein n=1 Tax=Macrophomina phaseolina (strain MS6) TaxID=1126212 RepID=K2RVR6_MACPH|nr:hypothetical protein MPH_05929 [Macrophomina phaseolina MS6]
MHAFGGNHSEEQGDDGAKDALRGSGFFPCSLLPHKMFIGILGALGCFTSDRLVGTRVGPRWEEEEEEVRERAAGITFHSLVAGRSPISGVFYDTRMAALSFRKGETGSHLSPPGSRAYVCILRLAFGRGQGDQGKQKNIKPLGVFVSMMLESGIACVLQLPRHGGLASADGVVRLGFIFTYRAF